MKKNTKKVPFPKMLTLLFTLIVFLVLVITVSIVFAITYLLIQCGLIKISPENPSAFPFLLLCFAIASVGVGTLVSFFLSRVPLKPLNILIHGMNCLASGDYKARINLGEYQPFKGVADSFNTLAQELGNTEMLRSDFINNLSHEFKTPIMSIYGFAQILNRKNISEQQKAEYMQIIEEESARLSSMATNVLNLTKVENQSILTDVTQFNLSEQLRSCLLILEKKWSKKNLEIAADFDEYTISANESLLKQVWINLLDNAVKFTPENGQITVKVSNRPAFLTVSIQNSGSEIDLKDRKYIFNKFYQGDTSHSSEGTGIGLAIAKKIVELHKGVIYAESNDEQTVFSVELPNQKLI